MSHTINNAYRIIKLEGSEALDFLQRLLTADTQKLTPNTHQLSALCNPKGRVTALFRLCRLEEALYLRVPSEQLEALSKRLQLFIFRSDVKLTRLEHWRVQLEQRASETDNGADDDQRTAVTANADGGFAFEPVAGFIEQWGPTELANHTSQRPATPEQQACLNAYRLAHIEQGIPLLEAEHSELFLPQMINLDLIDAVSFKKGCFPGQEVVARTQHLGKIKRRLRAYHTTLAQLPAAGELLVNGEKKAGEVLSAAYDSAGHAVFSAVIYLDQANEALRLEQHPDQPLTPLN